MWPWGSTAGPLGHNLHLNKHALECHLKLAFRIEFKKKKKNIVQDVQKNSDNTENSHIFHTQF